MKKRNVSVSTSIPAEFFSFSDEIEAAVAGEEPKPEGNANTLDREQEQESTTPALAENAGSQLLTLNQLRERREHEGLRAHYSASIDGQYIVADNNIVSIWDQSGGDEQLPDLTHSQTLYWAEIDSLPIIDVSAFSYDYYPKVLDYHYRISVIIALYDLYMDYSWQVMGYSRSHMYYTDLLNGKEFEELSFYLASYIVDDFAEAYERYVDRQCEEYVAKENEFNE